MIGFLLDTNVLSEFARAVPANDGVNLWVKGTPDSGLFASVPTFAEIRRGIELLPMGKRRQQLEDWLEEAWTIVREPATTGHEGHRRPLGRVVRAGATSWDTPGDH